MTGSAMLWIALLSSACLWRAVTSGVLEVRCANVEAGKKLTIPASAVNLQDACQLRVEVTPEANGTYSFVLGISALTQYVSREDIYKVYMGIPKVLPLVNKTETFSNNNLFAIRSVPLDDIALAAVRTYLGDACGTVYLLAALDDGARFVDTAVIGARIECPDETGMDLAPVISGLDSLDKDESNAIILHERSRNIPIQIAVENRGKVGLSARTDPDALRVWVHVTMNGHMSSETVTPAPDFDVLPEPEDVMISSANVFGLSSPGSPGIAAGGAVPLTLSQLTIPDHLCGDGMVIVNVDPIGELSDANKTNNAVAIKISSGCYSHQSQCEMFSMPGTGSALVSQRHGMMTTGSMIEYRAVSGAVRPLERYMMSPRERLELTQTVALSHAIDAEVDRLEAIGSCGLATDAEQPGWESSILGRLADSLANVRRPLSAVLTESEFERRELDMAATIVESVGQLLQQPGSLRTILSAVLHNDTGMFGYGGAHGYDRPGRGGGYGPDGMGGNDFFPGFTTEAYSSSSGYYSGSFSDYSGSSGDYSGSSGDYSMSSGDYSGSSGDYSDISGDYSGSSGDYSGSSGDYSGSSGDYSGSSGDYSGSSGDYSGSSGDYSGSSGDYSTSSGDYSSSQSGQEQFPESEFSAGGDIGPVPLETGAMFRRKRQVLDPTISFNQDGMGFSGGYNMDNFFTERPYASGGMGGMGGMNGMGGMDGMGGMGGPERMFGPVVRLQMFMYGVGMHVAHGAYQRFRLPGCMSEAMNENFRRFLKAVVWNTSVQEIPGYEEVSPEFVGNLRRLIRSIMSEEMEPALFSDNYPSSFGEAMGRWGESLNVDPMRPLPDGLAVRALQQIDMASRNMSFHEYEYNREKKNQTLTLLGKVARALLDNDRETVLDKFADAAVDLHRELATGGLAAASGQPGDAPDRRHACRKMAEMPLKKHGESVESPMLVKRDGDIYSVQLSPLTHEVVWRKAVACECSGPPIAY